MRTNSIIASLGLLAVGTSMASADTELAYNMEGITITDGGFVYGIVGNYPELEGLPILRIGVRNLEVEFLNDSTIAFCYALDLTDGGYGIGIYNWNEQGPFDSGSIHSFTEEWGVEWVAAKVAPSGYWGESWNLGPFLGSTGVDNAYTVISGEMYFIIDDDFNDPCLLPLADAPCNADLDDSGEVNVTDLLTVIGDFGAVGDGDFRPMGDCAPLPSGDCAVTVEDILSVIAAFGSTCPIGGCCMDDGSCSIVAPNTCDAMGGAWLGDGSDCSVCVVGACCLGDGTCTDLLPEACAAAGGWHTTDTCDLTDCAVFNGACCLSGPTCLDNLSIAECDAFGGVFQGDGALCTDVQCD